MFSSNTFAQVVVICGLALGTSALSAEEPKPQPSKRQEDESLLQFVQRLRKAGKFEQALAYLDKLSQSKDQSKDEAAVIPLERGLTLAAWAKRTAKAKERMERNAAALKEFTVFLKEKTKHKRAAEAFFTRANILRGQAEADLAAVEVTPTNERKSQLRAAARKKLAAARADYQQALNQFQTQYRTFPKYIPPDRKEELRKRLTVLVNVMTTMLGKALTRFREAQTYAADTKERRKAYQAAAEEFGGIHARYRSQVGGLYAQMWLGRCYQVQDEIGRALGIYNELLSHPGKSKTLRNLQHQVLSFKLMCLNHPKRRDYLLVEQFAKDWLTKNPANSKTLTGLSIRYELARAQEAIANAANTPAEKRADYLDHALENAQAVQQYPTHLRRRASLMVARLHAAIRKSKKQDRQ